MSLPSWKKPATDSILLTERGSSFGYNNLVVDMRSLAIMRSFGYPVVFDATHSVQLPGGGGDRSAGQREFVPVLARAAAAVGIDALFLEVHDDPAAALSDGPNMVPLSDLEALLGQVLAVDCGCTGGNVMYGEQARRCLAIEAKAVESLMERIDGDFDKAIGMILECSGRVVVTGIGKSGLIGRKISATLASTGTPSFFLHPSEGLHGDVGMVTEADIVLALSNSGDTAEMIGLLPALKRIGARIIAMCGRRDSVLALNADLFLDVGVEQEACPLGLTPTASTTAVLAMGDAMAMVLLSARKFSAADFAVFHPGGALGQKLLTVADHMRKGADNPVIPHGKTVREALFCHHSQGSGCYGGH